MNNYDCSPNIQDGSMWFSELLLNGHVVGTVTADSEEKLEELKKHWKGW